jgi:hypothetical protein
VLTSCVPIASFSSSNNGKHYETIDYNDFSVKLHLWGLLHGNHSYIALDFESKDSLTIWPKRLRVFNSGDSLFYRIHKGSKEYEQETLVIHKGTDWITYDVPGPGTIAGDTISFFGPRMFQRGDKFYDLGTLIFIMDKPSWLWGG